jgi:hypothetical protein
MWAYSGIGHPIYRRIDPSDDLNERPDEEGPATLVTGPQVGGASRTRTLNLLIKSQLLYQLS